MRIFVYSYGVPSNKNPMNGIFAFDQAKALTSLGHEVVMLVLDLRSLRRVRKLLLKIYVKDNIHVIQFSLPVGAVPSLLHDRIDGLFSKYLFRRAAKLFGTPDVVHSHFLRQSYSMSRALKNYRIKLYSTIHDSHLMNGISNSDLVKLVQVQSNSIIITVSPKLSSVLRANSISSVVINNVIDDGIFNYKNNLSDGPKKYALSAGALIKRKGMYELIMAWNNLPSEINTKLIILGDGPEKRRLLVLIEQLGLSERVELYGVYDRLQFAKELNNAKYFVLASKNESFGVVYAEALAHGIPVIATRCGGPEQLINDENGLLTEVDNPDELLKAIELMEKKHKTYYHSSISMNIIREYGTGSIANKLVETYNENKKT